MHEIIANPDSVNKFLAYVETKDHATLPAVHVNIAGMITAIYTYIGFTYHVEFLPDDPDIYYWSKVSDGDNPQVLESGEECLPS